MSTIHLRNCTAQRREFYYRLDFKDNPALATRADRVNFRRVVLSPWGIGHIELEKSMVAEVGDQLAVLNGQPVDALSHLRGVVPLIWSVDNPVDPRAAQVVVEHNRGVRWNEGVDRRKKAAVVASETLLSQLGESGHLQAAPPQGFEVEIEQDDGTQPEGGERLEEGFKIEGGPLGKPKGKGGGRAQAHKA